MKVVLDTNVLFAALSNLSEYYSIWVSLQLGRYNLCVSTDILNEYEEKLQERFRPGVAENTFAERNFFSISTCHFSRRFC